MKKLNILFAFLAFSAVLPAQNWQPLAVGVLPTGLAVWSISAVDENVVWATASTDANPISPTHKILVLRSSDGGQHWTLHAVEEATGTISYDIVAVDSLTAWLTTQDFGSGIGRALYKTTDGGINWTKKLENRAAGVDLNRFTDGQHWLATNRIYVGHSADDGENWTVDTLPSLFANESQTLWSGVNTAAVFDDMAWRGTDSGRVVLYTDYGQSVEVLPGLGNGFEIYSLAFHDHFNGLAVNIGNSTVKIAKTTDGGQTWVQLANQPGNFDWNIAAVPGSQGYYVLSTAVYNTSGRVAITRDFGESWSSQIIGKTLNSVQFTSPQTGWLGSGKITSAIQPALYKYIGSPLSGTKTPVGALSNFSVSPTPTKDLVQLDFGELHSVAVVVGTLTDLSGRVVFVGEILDNTLDISFLPAGVYFLKVEIGGKTSVAKLVKQ